MDTVEPTWGQLRHYSNGLSQPRPSPPLIPDSNILQHSKLFDLYSVLQCGPFEVRTRTPESPLDWTQTRETLSVTEAVPRPSLGVLEGLPRSNRGYSCPEPMWVTNRRGREGTLTATLFPEVSCSRTPKPTGQRCHMTRQREAKGRKSLHHEGQATGKLWLLPLWVAPPCDLWSPPLSKFSVKLRLGHNS